MVCLKMLSRSLSRSVNFGKGHSFPLKKFKFHRLEENCLPTTVTLSRPEALKYFSEMTAIRLMENEAAKLYMERSIKGFCHLYTGQESCAVGIADAINKDDAIITSYRAHSWTYIRGVSIADILCELTGRATGCSNGKGGSMHTYASEFYGGNGIVGSQVPLGTGIAWAHKYRKNGRISVVLYGDGAANQGQVFESFNMAALWKLPVIYMCENNLYGMGTSIERASACHDFYTRGDYIPGIQVQGSCVLSVREATKFCHNWCVSGKGPILIELLTYRYSGHSMSDPGTSYRKIEDVQQVRKTNDPISYFSGLITESGLVTESELEEIKDKLQLEVDEARKRALSDKFPDLSELGLHVHVGGTKGGYVRGCDPYTIHDSSR